MNGTAEIYSTGVETNFKCDWKKEEVIQLEARWHTAPKNTPQRIFMILQTARTIYGKAN